MHRSRVIFAKNIVKQARNSRNHLSLMDLAYGVHEVYTDVIESHRPVPAPFLIKTYQLVDDANTDAIVSWSDDGTTFIVWRPPEFATDILPNYFKHNNFSSFVRQLNTYGFRKTAPQRWEFANDYFRKGHSHLLCEIHRRIRNVPPQISGNVLPICRSSPSDSGEEQTWSSRCTSSPTEASATNSVFNENDILRRDNCILLSELARIQRLYDNAILFLKNETKLPLQVLEQKIHSSESLWFRSCQVDSAKVMVEQLNAVSEIQNNLFKDSANQKRPWNVQNSIEIYSSRGGNATSHGSTIAYVQGKLQELITCSAKSIKQDASCDVLPVPKLFGVPLCERKRLHPDLRNESDIHSYDYIKSCATSKTLKSDVTSRRSTATSVELPWFRCSAARDHDKRVHVEYQISAERI